jgi:hypothetical protein
MATWITHLRIAEKLIKTDVKLNNEAFIIGNIAPDCGVSIQNDHHFDPPKELTHFKDEFISYHDYDQINIERFYNQYVIPNHNKADYSFYLGYYLHLLVDILWHQFQMSKRKDQVYNQQFLKNNPLYRKELLQLDLQYIYEVNPNIYHEMFIKINSVKDYLDIIPIGIITNHVNHIKSFYNHPYIKGTHTIFTTYDELSKFIDDSTIYINNHIDKLINNTKNV